MKESGPPGLTVQCAPPSPASPSRHYGSEWGNAVIVGVEEGGDEEYSQVGRREVGVREQLCRWE